jgi:pimeloyl-ACP methyl ester carboxylesterase
MVVMMNPGSSRPLSGDDDGRVETAAVPDETQRQIMKVMDARGFRFARILNLSDYRQADSTDFASMLKTLDHAGIHHSIFGPGRETDFERLFDQSLPVILAWGADDRLKPLARRALDRMKNPVQAGQKKKGSDWIYYHPRQRGKPPQDWVDSILGQL